MRVMKTASLAVLLLLLGVPSSALAQAPQLFPVEARFAYIDFQRIASDSTSGKLANRILQELRDKKISEIEGRSKQLQTLKSPKEIDRMQREIEFAQANARVEVEQLQAELLTKFEKQVTPVVAEIAKERNLLAVFTSDSNLFYINPALDISHEVIKRLDTAAARTPR
jgi:Skp family chaperone for outer membrane proteins